VLVPLPFTLLPIELSVAPGKVSPSALHYSSKLYSATLDVIKASDYVLDLGPEGGRRGGFVVAAGTPEEIAAVADSHTGRFLRDEVGLA